MFGNPLAPHSLPREGVSPYEPGSRAALFGGPPCLMCGPGKPDLEKYPCIRLGPWMLVRHGLRTKQVVPIISSGMHFEHYLASKRGILSNRLFPPTYQSSQNSFHLGDCYGPRACKYPDRGPKSIPGVQHLSTLLVVLQVAGWSPLASLYHHSCLNLGPDLLEVLSHSPEFPLGSLLSFFYLCRIHSSTPRAARSAGLAYRAGRIGGTMPAILSAANEQAVELLLTKARASLVSLRCL